MNLSISTLFFSFNITFHLIRPLFLYEKIIVYTILFILFFILYRSLKKKIDLKNRKHKTIDLFLKKIEKDIKNKDE